jgi:hypothetical protein
MAAKRKTEALPIPAPIQDVSSDHRIALAGAYRDGLIMAWKRDALRGFCLTLSGRADEYVEPDRLTRYLEKLKGPA